MTTDTHKPRPSDLSILLSLPFVVIFGMAIVATAYMVVRFPHAAAPPGWLVAACIAAWLLKALAFPRLCKSYCERRDKRSGTLMVAVVVVFLGFGCWLLSW